MCRFAFASCKTSAYSLLWNFVERVHSAQRPTPNARPVKQVACQASNRLTLDMNRQYFRPKQTFHWLSWRFELLPIVQFLLTNPAQPLKQGQRQSRSRLLTESTRVGGQG